MMKVTNEKQRHTRAYELPSHAYHPNASLRNHTRTGYVAMPERQQQAH
ncbi:MAG: hypothetical protein J6X70_01465 [Muribaculaceae bacterium]|nr:hypothetical protein [Muribaculaceae bacterium]